MIDKEFLKKSGFIIVGLFLFFVFAALSDGGITGYFGFGGGIPNQVNIGLIILIVAIVILFLILVNRGNLKEIFKNIVSAFAIYVGLYTITIIIPNLDLLIGLISISFGLMAIIWVLRARNVLSKGSSLKAYTTSFLFCVIFILLFSLYDSYITIFNVKGSVVYLKYFLVTLIYIIIAYTSYKTYLLGSEFGFSEERSRIKKALGKK